MNIKFTDKKDEIIKDNFYYLQLTDTLIPLIISFILSVFFINFISEHNKTLLGSFDETVVLLGIACSVLFVGLIVKSLDLMHKSEKNFVINTKENTLRVHGKMFDLHKVKILYKPKEYRPIKIFHLFFSDVDTVQLLLKDGDNKAYVEIKQENFELLQKEIEVFKDAKLQGIFFKYSVLHIFSSIVIVASFSLLIALSFFYFIVR